MKIFPLLSLLHLAVASVYFGSDKLLYLLNTQSLIINNLKQYVNLEQKKIKSLRQHLVQLQTYNLYAQQDIESYAGNPITAYSLMKRLTKTWQAIKNLGKTGFYNKIVKEAKGEDDTKLPSREDLNKSATALLRIQDTYEISTADMAIGDLYGIHSKLKLDPNDCLEIAKMSIALNDVSRSYMWASKALRLHVDTYNEFSDGDEIVRFLNSFKNSSVGAYVDKYQETHTDWYQHYFKLCRGEISTPTKITAKLKCYLSNNNLHFLRIAPIKVEEIHLNPKVVIAHNVLYDNEIEILKNKSYSKLMGSLLVDYDGLYEDKARISSKTAYLATDASPILNSLSQRVSDMANLNVAGSEDFSVVYYSVGGHFEPHYDPIFEESILSALYKTGNRIATVILYLNDVIKGGCTVFTSLNVSVTPQKGSALIWFNLRANGEIETDTMHGGCPVIIGSKWITTKWLHEHNQEFLRPCSLDKDAKLETLSP